MTPIFIQSLPKILASCESDALKPQDNYYERQNGHMPVKWWPPPAIARQMTNAVLGSQLDRNVGADTKCIRSSHSQLRPSGGDRCLRSLHPVPPGPGCAALTTPSQGL
jgi:hypothetical protein